MSDYRANVVADEYGVDALRDHNAALINSVGAYDLFEVTEEFAGRPDLIAYHAYSEVELWWVVMVYNGLTMYRDINPGQVLKLPRVSYVEAQLHQGDSATANYKSVSV